MHGKLLTMGRTRRSLSLVIQALAESRQNAPQTMANGTGTNREVPAVLDTTREKVLTQDEIEMLLNAKSMEAAQTA